MRHLDLERPIAILNPFYVACICTKRGRVLVASFQFALLIGATLYAIPAKAQVQSITLRAPIANGDMSQFRSRFYVCNSSPGGSLLGPTASLKKMGVTGSTGTPFNAAPIVTTQPVAAGGCLNIRLEDLMTAGGLGSTFTVDGGNLAVELTFSKESATPLVVQGVVNVINIAPSTGRTTSPVQGPESYLTYPLLPLP